MDDVEAGDEQQQRCGTVPCTELVFGSGLPGAVESAPQLYSGRPNAPPTAMMCF